MRIIRVAPSTNVRVPGANDENQAQLTTTDATRSRAELERLLRDALRTGQGGESLVMALASADSPSRALLAGVLELASTDPDISATLLAVLEQDKFAGSLVRGVLDAVSTLVVQPGEAFRDADPLTPRLPAITTVKSGRGQPLRFGFFNGGTDRDRFISELLGSAAVPKTPRYPRRDKRRGVLLPLGLQGGLEESAHALGLDPRDLQDVRSQAVESGRLEPDDRDWVLDRAFTRPLLQDAGLAAIARALLSADPEAFAASPIGGAVLSLAAAGPLQDEPLAQFAIALEAGPLGVLGLAWWDPGAIGLRQHRRAMAAHLRYLFDFAVAPWGRYADLRRRRECLAVYGARRAAYLTRGNPTSPLGSGSAAMGALDDAAKPIGDIARRLRARYRTDYASESEETTLRRLYRMSASFAASWPRRRGSSRA